MLALHADRQRLIAELNECDAALNDLAQAYRVAHELPEGEYQFRGDGNEIRIVRVEKPVPAVSAPEEKPVDEVETEGASVEEEQASLKGG